MYQRVGLKVFGVAEDAHEDIFGTDVDEKCTRDAETDDTDTVGYLLDKRTSAAERWRCDPFAAVPVHDNAEGQVAGGDKTLSRVS